MEEETREHGIKGEVMAETKKRLCMVALTEAELLAAGDKLANAQQKYAQLEDERKRVNDGYKSSMKEEEDACLKLGRMIRERKEERLVTCVKEMLWDKDVALVRREDTMAVIERRDITASERQLHLRGLGAEIEVVELPLETAEDVDGNAVDNETQSEEDLDEYGPSESTDLDEPEED